MVRRKGRAGRQHRAQFRRQLIERRCHRLGLRPAHGRRRILALSLLKMGLAHQRHEMPRIDPQDAVQRDELSRIVAQLPAGAGKIEPQDRLARIDGGRALEQLAGPRRVALGQGPAAERIQGLRMVGRQHEHLLQQARRHIRPLRLLLRRGGGQKLGNARVVHCIILI